VGVEADAGPKRSNTAVPKERAAERPCRRARRRLTGQKQGQNSPSWHELGGLTAYDDALRSDKWEILA
jgi:hypothetical protein